MGCLNKIDHELSQPIDKHSKTLIANNIELLLNYCMRFYDRQFITRSVVNKDILGRFENLLDNYLSPKRPDPRFANCKILCRPVAPVCQLFRRPDKKGNREISSGKYPVKGNVTCQGENL